MGIFILTPCSIHKIYPKGTFEKIKGMWNFTYKCPKCFDIKPLEEILKKEKE